MRGGGPPEKDYPMLKSIGAQRWWVINNMRIKSMAKIDYTS